MAWWWWLLLPIVPIVAFVAGLVGGRWTKRPTGPDRRVGERRTRDRRSGDRGGPDRRGPDRRRPRPVWPAVTVVASVMALAGVVIVSYAVTPVPSFFEQGQTQLIGSGWAACETPITWSTDTSRLTVTDARIAITQAKADVAKWSEASGLTFRYVGEVPVGYDKTTLQLLPTRHPSDRHIFIAFLHNRETSLLDSRTVGLAMPSKVVVGPKEIVEGSVVLSIEYVKKVNARRESALYLHELGHALGLGHGPDDKAVMYYIVGTNNELSPDDIEGIRRLTKVCAP